MHLHRGCSAAPWQTPFTLRFKAADQRLETDYEIEVRAGRRHGYSGRTHMLEKLGIKLFRAEARVCDQGRIEIGTSPFAAGETVEVIALPSKFAKSAARLLDLVVRSVTLDSFQWTDVTVQTARRFEDLAFLFESSVLNRGLIRLDLDEAAAVFKTVSELATPRGVEIGRFNGGSTFLLAAAVGEGGKLLSIDIAPKDDIALVHALTCAGIDDRVELVTADANRVAPDGDYAFAFIDGDHSYEGGRCDHNRWGRRVTPGGVIIHHDMSNNRRHSTQIASLARLREDIIRQQEGVVQLERETGSVAIFRRTDAPWIDVEASVQTVSA